MRALLYALILLLLSVACQNKESPFDIQLTALPKDIAPLQKQLLGQLSGEYPIPSAQQEQKIQSRWTNPEKALCRAYLRALITSLGLEAREHPYRMQNLNPAIDLLLEPFKGTNIYTILPATTPTDEYVVLGAHYDTGNRNVPGAIDNASGMVLAFSVLHQLVDLPKRNKNVMLVFFDQEEEEMIGSLAFAKWLKKQKYEVHSVHTFDMIGWDSDHNREVELEMPSEYLETLYQQKAATLAIPVYTTQINSTDHYSFIQQGFQAVGISQAYAKRDNSGKKDTPEDTFELVNFPYLLSSTHLVIEVLKEIIQT